MNFFLNRLMKLNYFLFIFRSDFISEMLINPAFFIEDESAVVVLFSEKF
ncbi:hypothetical protein RV12_GL001432 [Enterococcus quebecensis]|nr:hypothetical protein RV12_GL001432 [Enterococcus quebecensis]